MTDKIEPLEVMESLPMPKETRAEKRERVSRETRAEQRVATSEGEARAEQGLALARQAGRPSTYDPEKAVEICTRLALGQSLASICKLETFPCEATVIKWLNNPSNLAGGSPFVKLYARARELQADAYFDSIIDIADDTSRDIITLPPEEGEEGNGKTVLNPVAVSRAKVRIDARFRLCGKLNPKKYGDKLEAYISGPDGGPIETTVIPADRLDRNARDRLREILATAKDITPE
jgi:hypothetical protein